MTRATVRSRWAILALLALGTCASIAAAGVVRDLAARRGLGGSPSRASALRGLPATNDERQSMRIVVGDAAGVREGLRLQSLDAKAGDLALTTDAFGAVERDVRSDFPGLFLRIVGDLGRSWAIEHPFPVGAPLPTEVVILLEGEEARVQTFGPDAFELERHAQILDELLQGREIAPDDAVLQGPLPEQPAPALSTARHGVDRARGAAQDPTQGMNAASGTGDDLLSGDLRSGTERSWTPGRSFDPKPVTLAWSGEVEPNDTPEECDAIDPADYGTILSGQTIASSGDYDWYCFPADCGDEISFTVTPTDGTGFRPRVEMYFDDGSSPGAALRRNFGTGFDVPTNITEIAPLTTTYVVLVRRGSSSFPSSYPYSYDLEVTTTPGPCPVDPGEPVWGSDDEPECNTILVPTAPGTFEESRAITWHGYRPFPNVTHMKDKDIYCVSLDCGERLDVTVTPTGDATLQPEVRFLAPQNMACAGCTPSAFYDAVFADAPGEVLTAGVEAAVAGGLWRVEISARDSSSNPTIGTYDVSFSRSEGFDCVVDEPNDTSEDCVEIVEGVREPATMFPETEDDWFCFDVPACGLRVAAQAVNPVGQYQTSPFDNPEVTLALFGPDDQMLGAQLSSNSDGYMGAAQFVSTVPGTYKVRVRGTRNVVGPENPGYFPTPTITGQYEMLLTMVDAKTGIDLDVTSVESPTETVVSAEARANLPVVPDITPGPGATFLTGFMSPTSPNPTGSGNQTIALPFPFEYYGEAKTELNIDQDGWMSFSDTSAGHIPIVIPAKVSPNDVLFVFRTGGVQPQLEPTPPFPEPRVYTDMRKSYEVLGSAPNRELVVTWSDMTYGAQGNPTGDVNFTASLFEGTNCIEYRYGVMDGLRYSEGQRGLVGLENADGTLGVNSSSFEPKIMPGMTITYCPDGAGGYSETVTPPETTNEPYPDTLTSCEYDVSVDSAPFVDISSSGTSVSEWATGNLVVNPDCPFAGDFFNEYLCFEEPLVSMFPPNVLLDPDDNYAPISLPFPFPYHGVIETEALVFLDGFIAFDSVNPFNDILGDGTNRCGNPEWDRMNGKVMPFWDELHFTQSGFSPDIVWDGDVYTQVDGVAPSRTFTIQWTAISTAPPFGTPPPNSSTTFQAILHEDGRIDFHYAGPTEGDAGAWHRATGSSATVGLEDREGRSQTIYWCNDSGGDFGDNWNPGGPAVSDRIVSFTPATAETTYEWFNDETGDLLATGPQLVADADTGACDIRLDVTARDPKHCCDTVESEFFRLELFPEVTAVLAPAPPLAPASPSSACLSPNSGLFIVECEGFDACDPDVAVAAQLLVTNHDVNAMGECSERVETVDVTCGEMVEIRMLSQVCSAKPPKAPRQASSVRSGLTVVMGESVILEALATDTAGLTAGASFDPTVDPSPGCELPLDDGSCCPSLAKPAPPKCPTSLLCGGDDDVIIE